jgi:site-specific recombinase XerC
MKYKVGNNKQRYDRCMKSLHDVLRENNRRHATGKKTISHATRVKRKKTIEAAFRYLYTQGYTLEGPHSLRRKHVDVLFDRWKEEGYSKSTIQSALSVLRVFFTWINKPGMMDEFDRKIRENGDFKEYVSREYAAKEVKAWVDINPWDKIREVEQDDPVVAMILALMTVFGLRTQEACQPENMYFMVCDCAADTSG